MLLTFSSNLLNNVKYLLLIPIFWSINVLFILNPRMQFVAQMDVAMGGRAAEELIFTKEKVT
jgi:hypothetical protein